MQGWLLTTYACLGSLFALTGLNQFVFTPDESTGMNFVWFGLQVLPLLLPLPGTMSGSIKATFTLCLVSLLYFIHGVVVCFEPNRIVFGLVEVTFALGMCAATSYLVRALREAEAAQTGQSDTSE